MDGCRERKRGGVANYSIKKIQNKLRIILLLKKYGRMPNLIVKMVVGIEWISRKKVKDS